MVAEKNMIRNILGTFSIGFIAGITPFLFMQLLPALLNPSLHLESRNYWPIILTGLLIGAITSIIFATKFESREAQDVFFYALGIPAVLIATVTNISTEYKALNKISEVQERLTGEVLNPEGPQIIPEKPKRLSPPKAQQPGARLGNRAWAEENKADGYLILAQGQRYLVVMGEYNSAELAWEEYNRLKNTKLRTERYAQKDLGVFQLSTGSYVLVYRDYPTLEEARKVYQLLRINDPGVSVKILEY